MRPCLSDDEILGFAAGTTTAAERPSILEALRGCANFRAISTSLEPRTLTLKTPVSCRFLSVVALRSSETIMSRGWKDTCITQSAIIPLMLSEPRDPTMYSA